MKKIIALLCVQGLLAATLCLRGNSSAIPPNYSNKSDSISVKYSSVGLDSIVTRTGEGIVVKTMKSYEFEGDRLVSCEEIVGEIITKHIYDYDDCGNQILYEVFKFDKDQNTFSLKFKETRAYQNSADCNDFLLLFYNCEGIPESEAIYVNEKNDYDYYPNGNIRKITKKNGSGTIIRETSYTYDANGRVETVLFKNLENYQLTPTTKIEYTYFPFSENVNHFKTESIYKYNDDNAEKICMKTSYPNEYFSDKSFVSTIEYYDDLEECIDKEVRTSEYSEDFARMMESKVEIYDKNKTLAATIKYDDKGNVVEIFKATLNESAQNSVWKREWSYNKQSGIDTYSLINRETDDLLWYMSVYYDKETATTDMPSFADTKKLKIVIFPNPVKDNLYIEYLNEEKPAGTNPLVYSIYSLTGKLQLHGINDSGEKVIPVQALSPGSYIISFVSGDFKGTSVFIKN